MRRHTLLLSICPVILFATGCDDGEPLSPAGAPGAQAAVQETLGKSGPGALYGMYVPDEWNGSLVLYVHGFRDAAMPVTLDRGNQENMLDTRALLNDVGYAVAYSSWSENGWSVRDGVQRTHQLRGLFAARYGTPERIYLVASSLGSLVALSLAEQHPEHYAGVLEVCGILGGGQATVNYIGNIRLLFDFFYPGVLPGSVTEPPSIDPNVLAGMAVAAMNPALGGNPTGAFTIAAVMQLIGTPLGASTALPETVIGTIAYAIAFHSRGFEDLTSRTHGHVAFDNSTTNYVLPAVQAAIPRHQAQPDALNFLRQWYEPTGRLQIPLVTLDAALDPIAPLFHKDRYAALLASTGAADLMVRTVVPGYGHCAVNVTQRMTAFQQLAGWVETGVRP